MSGHKGKAAVRPQTEAVGEDYFTTVDKGKAAVRPPTDAAGEESPTTIYKGKAVFRPQIDAAGEESPTTIDKGKAVVRPQIDAVGNESSMTVDKGIAAVRSLIDAASDESSMAVNKGKAAVKSSSGGTDKDASETEHERKRFARYYGKGVTDNESSPAADKDKMPPTTSKKEALESSFSPGEDPVDPHFAHNPYVKQPPSGRFQEHLPQGLVRTKSEEDETKTSESAQKEHSTDASNPEAPPGSKRAALQALTARMRAKIKKVEEESLRGRASSGTPQAERREPGGMLPRSPSGTTQPRNRLLKQVHQPAMPGSQRADGGDGFEASRIRGSSRAIVTIHPTSNPNHRIPLTLFLTRTVRAFPSETRPNNKSAAITEVYPAPNAQGQEAENCAPG
ncbi:hypothetical protein IWX90DRAFT_488140 [Phyllosticta citrichinensis]|uniref:Uncharacterized protein n=1 Tax=Phyllosticta citrichinensis TaxID=1130410 RepID=A0ABR1XN93_9PEZI